MHAEDHMQNFLVKGASFHESSPQGQGKIAYFKPISIIVGQNNELLDQSDQVLLKIMEDRLPTALALRFPILMHRGDRL